MIDTTTLLTIVLMAGITYLTRAAGYVAFRNPSPGARATGVMEAAPGCVLISVIAPRFVLTSPAGLAALAVTVAAATRLSLLATAVVGVTSAGHGLRAGEEQGGWNLFRDAEGRVALAVSASEQKAVDGQRRPLCTNSLDLVVRMRQHSEGRADFTHADGVRWLAEEFGEGRATAALVVNREHAALAWFGR